LEQARPQAALGHWRQLLLQDRAAVRAHVQAAAATLAVDPLAPLRRQALGLIGALLAGDPGEAEVVALGALLRRWGELCYAEAPGRALQHWERAWGCGRDPQLALQLAGLYRRLGFGEGASWLEDAGGAARPAAAAGPVTLEPWPSSPCAAQACSPCQQKPAPDDPPLQLWQVPGGRCWVQRHTNPWGHSHGLAVQTAEGNFLPELCRRYPWPWPTCSHLQTHRDEALRQLGWLAAVPAAAGGLPPQVHHAGPVLAIAELSGELYFHWQLELLPRLGRCWPELQRQWPGLRLWHNGGTGPWVAESLERLGIPPERRICAQQVPHLQAELLLVPSFASAFGSPAGANLAWLEQFWAVGSTGPLAPARGGATDPPLLLPRPATPRRALLGLDAAFLPGVASLPLGPVADQLLAVAHAQRIVAPHGAALANLIAAQPSTAVLELVNPAYQPPYFAGLMQRRQLAHQVLPAAATPWPLQELLYEGPLAFPIDLRPGGSPAAEAIAQWCAAHA
jgi:hypothetical protein